MSSPLKVSRALISVSDKTNLSELVNGLVQNNIALVSTGNTAKAIRELGHSVQEVSDLTNVPEMLDGRVKTLHPNVHAAILADKSNPDHLAQLTKLGLIPFDLVVINLYPFAKTVNAGSDFSTIIENIDIGGPAMIRGAAKNFNSILVVTDPEQYDLVLSQINNGSIDYETRLAFARLAFEHTAKYDLAIANWFAAADNQFFGLAGEKVTDLRYGENPHQKATMYRTSTFGVANSIQLHGKELSFNNLVDADAAWRAVHDHDSPTIAIIKHANPCGIASADSISLAYEKAHRCDPVSAFGAVIASNSVIDENFAQANAEIFTEVIIAPGFTNKAIELLSTRKNLRLLQANGKADKNEIKAISGGFLLQEVDTYTNTGDIGKNWNLVSGAPATDEEMQDLIFAWRCIRSVKSNAIVLAKSEATVGIGMGQVNRVDSVRLAVARAGNRAPLSVAASDAFFPFSDGVQELIDAGIRAIVQPGGSIRDDEVIDLANQNGITMYLTGVRHFWH